jgi:hypothetical protein
LIRTGASPNGEREPGDQLRNLEGRTGNGWRVRILPEPDKPGRGGESETERAREANGGVAKIQAGSIDPVVVAP